MTHHLVKLEKEALEFRKASEHKKAIAIYEQIIAENPNWEHGYMYYHLALSEEEIGELDNAREHYLKATEIDPYDDIRLIGYATFLYLHGGSKEAYDAYLTLYNLEKSQSQDTEQTIMSLMELGKKLNMTEEEIKKDLER